jgi:hypothetical protein
MVDERSRIMGKKRLRNVPVLYDEKKQTHQITLTPTAWKMVTYLATLKGLSVSEFIEQWIRSHAT